MTQNNEQSLVTVSVVTYNSANYIEATLQSVWSQSYPHIELIISDDASTDDTVAICRQWLLKHKERFVRTQIIVSEFNTGVSANRNRAEVTARGCYIKPLAGDDQLTPEAISRYVTHIESHPNFIISLARLKPSATTQTTLPPSTNPCSRTIVFLI